MSYFVVMADTIIGRKQPIADLKRAYASGRPELIALVGRRRIGKTFLVRQVYGSRIDYELTGLQNGGLKAQLLNFKLAMNSYFPDHQFGDEVDNWLVAFNELAKALQSKQTERRVVFLDEVPWLGTPRSGFITALGFFWNSWAHKLNAVVVICGSAAAWMIRKVINDRGGLHNRVTRLLYLYPFTLAETEAFCRSRRIQLDRYQLLQLYFVMGGVPMYLDQLQPGRSAVQNIDRVCFAETGYLRYEFDRLFTSLFKNYEQHVAIVRALASRHYGLTRGELIIASKLSNGGGVTKALDELEKSGFITEYGGYRKRAKDRLYRLTDSYCHFYLTYLEPLGKGRTTAFTQLSSLPRWSSWSGYAFENVCLTHIPAIRKALGISGISTSIASFYTAATKMHAGAQIDLVIDRADRSISLCEIKHSASIYTITQKEVEALQRRKQVFQQVTRTNKHVFTVLITPFGAKENAYRVGYVDQIVVLDDLFGH